MTWGLGRSGSCGRGTSATVGGGMVALLKMVAVITVGPDASGPCDRMPGNRKSSVACTITDAATAIPSSRFCEADSNRLAVLELADMDSRNLRDCGP